MAIIDYIYTGAVANDGTGDTLRQSQIKANDNFAELNDKKVEVEAGFGLSENNYSDTDKSKLDGIEGGAQVNVQPDWNQEDPDEDDYIKNKPTIESTTQFIFDGIIGVTSGFTVGQTAFILPSPDAIAQRVYINGALQYKTTANNGTLVNRWSQSDDTVTITKTTVLNNYIYIEYV